MTTSASVASYGGGGGTIAINVEQSALGVAPESARLSVDLSGATFDAQAPAAGANYDPRMHDLVYLWDTGDTGTYANAGRSLDAWKDKSKAKGPWVAHCYTTPGTYTVSVLVVEPATGKTATASAQVTVADPDAVYAGQATICVNPAGSSDTSWGPSGAVYVALDGAGTYNQMDTQSWWAGNNDGTGRRVLLDPNQTYPRLGIALSSSNDLDSLWFGGHGGAVALDANFASENSGRIVNVSNTWTGTECRCSGLAVTGTFDNTVSMRSGPDVDDQRVGTVYRTDKGGVHIVSDCTVTGNKSTAYYFQAGAGEAIHTHLNECAATGYGGQYGAAFWQRHDDRESSMAVTGFDGDQGDGAWTGGGDWAGSFRDQGHQFAYLQAVDVHCRDDKNTPIKLMTQPTVTTNHVVNVWGVVSEGGDAAIWVFANRVNGQYVPNTIDANVIIDGAVLLRGYMCQNFVSTSATGVTIRNMLGILADTLPQTTYGLGQSPAAGNFTFPAGGGPEYISALFYGGLALSLNGAGTTAEHLASPIRMYSCTLLADRALADNKFDVGGPSNQLLVTRQAPNSLTPGALTVENNVLVGEWQGGETGGTYTTATLFAPRDLTGYRGYNGDITVAGTATPAGAVKDTKPASGAALDAATSGYVAYDDIVGTARGSTPDLGAWEVT